MTHSLHRRGSIDSLKNDFVFIARSSVDVNRKGCGPKFQRIRQILNEAGPVNAGMMETGENMARGNFVEQWLDRASDDTIIAATFSSREKIRRVLSELKKEDLGISITVSGLMTEVFEMARELGLTPHTVNLSLGVHGKKELLPPEETLQVTTMCGHALAATSLAQQLKAKIKAGRITPKEAARQLAEPCVCGIFNMERAEVLLRD
ncbi:MAG: hypothetical protein Q8O07_00510 [Chloroflexota bacterium]|nr:hypothetical protein [Chloroflexota bacterium]